MQVLLENGTHEIIKLAKQQQSTVSNLLDTTYEFIKQELGSQIQKTTSLTENTIVAKINIAPAVEIRYWLWEDTVIPDKTPTHQMANNITGEGYIIGDKLINRAGAFSIVRMLSTNSALVSYPKEILMTDGTTYGYMSDVVTVNFTVTEAWEFI